MANASSFISGQVSVSTAAAQLATGQPNANTNVVLYAHSGNASTVYVGGDSTVTTTTGYALDAGKSVALSINNVDEVWSICGGGSNKISFVS